VAEEKEPPRLTMRELSVDLARAIEACHAGDRGAILKVLMKASAAAERDESAGGTAPTARLS